MTSTRLWDRASVVPVPVDGRRFAAVAALPEESPSVAALFEFMRDAELRFGTLRMRIIERTWNARGEDATQIDVAIRHPGHVKVTTSRPGKVIGGAYEIWTTDGELVRTYASAHKLGTQRPVRQRPRGLEDPDFPGTAQIYQPVTALPAETLPETFLHPAGYCQNVLATGACAITGDEVIRGRDAIVVECASPRVIEMPADRPDFRIQVAVDRELGCIVRLIETIGGEITRHAEVVDLEPDVTLPPSAFDFVFPTGTTMLY